MNKSRLISLVVVTVALGSLKVYNSFKTKNTAQPLPNTIGSLTREELRQRCKQMGANPYNITNESEAYGCLSFTNGTLVKCEPTGQCRANPLWVNAQVFDAKTAIEK